MRFNKIKFTLALLAAGTISFSVQAGKAGDAIQVGHIEGQALEPIPESHPVVYQDSCPECEHHHHHRSHRFLRGLFSHKKLVSPAEGWSRIVKQPVRRTPVRYWRYWPSKWAGQPGYGLQSSYPMVYMPTDTTQLGYYYQGAPQWMPNPSMIPPVPHPYQWHRRECPMGVPVNHYGEVIDQGVYNTSGGTPVMESPQSTPQTVFPTPAQPQEPATPVLEKAA